MKFHQLEGNQCWVRLPKGVLERACAIEARQNKDGLIALLYEDGTRCEAPSPQKDLHDFASWFEIVQFVQNAQTKN